MNKATAEKMFVEEILRAGGIDNHAETDEGRKTYYEFRLKNGTRRYWTNMSDESLVKLGVDVNG
jgi:hypothetical protein